MSDYRGPERRRGSRFGRAVRELGSEPAESSRWHHIWRDFVPLIALVIAAYAVFGVEGKVDQATVDVTVAKRLAETQSDGRRVSLGVTCGALRGVEDAGRLVLTQKLPGTERYVPKTSAREQRVREVFARAYNAVITARIVQEAGVAGAQVVDENGSVDCDRLREVARAPAPSP